MGRFEMNQEY